jgi:hypothetical protein
MVTNPRCQNAAGCGPYTAPLVSNPNWKGEWSRPQIKNPRWKGEWRARQIPNPDWYEDPDPLAGLPPITGAGFEIWAVTKDFGFANVYIGTDEAAVRQWNEDHFVPKHLRQDFENKQLEAAQSNSLQGPEIGEDKIGPLLRSEREGTIGAIVDFVGNFLDALNALYEENPAITTVGTAGVITVPIVLFAFCAFWSEDEDEETPEEKERRRKRKADARRKKIEKEAAARRESGEGEERGAGEDQGEQHDATQRTKEEDEAVMRRTPKEGQSAEH